VQIDLTPEEIALLRELLKTAHGDLREEIYKTENVDFKSLLKGREKALESLIEKLSA
jgi:hypothetical protein